MHSPALALGVPHVTTIVSALLKGAHHLVAVVTGAPNLGLQGGTSRQLTRDEVVGGARRIAGAGAPSSVDAPPQPAATRGQDQDKGKCT